MVTAKIATLRLDSVMRETAEDVTVAILKLMNVNKRIVVNVEFVKKMSVLISANFVPFALNVRMKNANSQMNAVLTTLVDLVKIAKRELVLPETVDPVVPVML